jgi:hypothetical protein
MYLSGADSPQLRERRHQAIGLMCQPKSGVSRFITQYPTWAADNGCFSQGERFKVEHWLSWLADLSPYRKSCLFAVAPDVVADAKATLARSLPIIPRIREFGFPVALAAQDGLERLRVPWKSFDVLFIGGSTEWKLSEHAAHLVAEAKRRHKWVHMGRCNSLIRLRAAQSMGVDSADGTCVAFGPDKRIPQLVRWLDDLARQPSLWQAGVG